MKNLDQKILSCDADTRAERDAFMQGIKFCCTQLRAAADTVERNEYASFTHSESGKTSKGIVKTGDPVAAENLRSVAEVLQAMGEFRAAELWADFEPAVPTPKPFQYKKED